MKLLLILSLILISMGCGKLADKPTQSKEVPTLPGSTPKTPNPDELFEGSFQLPTFDETAEITEFEGIWQGPCVAMNYDIGLSGDRIIHVASEQQFLIIYRNAYQSVFGQYKLDHCQSSDPINNEPAKFYNWYGMEMTFEVAGNTVNGNGAKRINISRDGFLFAKDIFKVETDSGTKQLRYGKKTSEDTSPEDYYEGYPLMLDESNYFTLYSSGS